MNKNDPTRCFYVLIKINVVGATNMKVKIKIVLRRKSFSPFCWKMFR